MWIMPSVLVSAACASLIHCLHCLTSLQLHFLSVFFQAAQDEAAAAHTAAARAVQAVEIHKRRIQELENEQESKAGSNPRGPSTAPAPAQPARSAAPSVPTSPPHLLRCAAGGQPARKCRARCAPHASARARPPRLRARAARCAERALFELMRGSDSLCCVGGSYFPSPGPARHSVLQRCPTTHTYGVQFNTPPSHMHRMSTDSTRANHLLPSQLTAGAPCPESRCARA